jgi:dipicolinate synthase subunit A
MKMCRVLIGPIPLTKDLVTVSDGIASDTGKTITHLLDKEHLLIGGVIPSDIVSLCNKKGVFCYDLMKSDKIAIMNAIATAEGTIMEAIKNSDNNLHHSNCLVLGYGRCGKVLAAKLKGLDTYTTIAARSEDALAYAHAAGFSTVKLHDIKTIISTYQYIFNTIPSLVLDQECLKLVSRDALIIDIASAPGGVDYEYALNHGINAKLCLGLPGKVAPRTSADILVTEIEALIKERSG